MAKPLQFEFDVVAIEFDMNKVDRSKLYGYKEVEVLDENGTPCELTTLADDGKTLIGKGGTGIGYLTADGNWCDKASLKAVDLEGKQMTPVPSSFSAPIKLETEISIDEYLNHNIRLIYQLGPKAGTEKLVERLMSGAIYKFPYSFRGGLEADAGLLLMNDDNEVYFLVGDETNVAFKGLQQAAAVAPSETEEDQDAGDSLIDFGMI